MRERKWHLLSLATKHNTVCGLEPLWYRSVTNSLQPRIAMWLENATCERCIKLHAARAKLLFPSPSECEEWLSKL